MRRTLMIALTALAGLQGCVVPAAMDAMKQEVTYDVVTQRQIDPEHFLVLVTIDHARGAFDPLGGHGHRTVTTSIDVELWRLSVADKGIETRKEDSLTFDTEKELDNWSRYSRGLGIDMIHGRIVRPRATEAVNKGQAFYQHTLQIDSYRHVVRSSVNGRECDLPLPPSPTEPNPRIFHVSDSGDHFMIADIGGDYKAEQATIFDACDASVPTRDIRFPRGEIEGFSVRSDGSPRAVRLHTGNSKAPSGERWNYEVLTYPNLERLTINEKDLGMNERGMPNDFMFEEKARRFHWIVWPAWNSTRFNLITHDFISGSTVNREFSLTER